MTITRAQFETVTVPSAWTRVPCTCRDGYVARGVQYPTKCRTCDGEGTVYKPKARVAL